MYRYLFSALIILVISTTIALAVSLQYFRAIPDGTQVQLEWEVLNEAGLARFDLYRKLDGEASYQSIGTITANNSGKYTYMDGGLLRSNGGGSELGLMASGGTEMRAMQRSIFYKLILVTNSGESAYYTSVSFNPSAVQRSWGSIKSMFR